MNRQIEELESVFFIVALLANISNVNILSEYTMKTDTHTSVTECIYHQQIKPRVGQIILFVCLKANFRRWIWKEPSRKNHKIAIKDMQTFTLVAIGSSILTVFYIVFYSLFLCIFGLEILFYPLHFLCCCVFSVQYSERVRIYLSFAAVIHYTRGPAKCIHKHKYSRT